MEQSVRFTSFDFGCCHTWFIADRCLSLNADAMQLFAQTEDKWYNTWPQSEDDRAMRMYVVSTLFSLENCADSSTLIVIT